MVQTSHGDRLLVHSVRVECNHRARGQGDSPLLATSHAISNTYGRWRAELDDDDDAAAAADDEVEAIVNSFENDRLN